MPASFEFGNLIYRGCTRECTETNSGFKKLFYETFLYVSISYSSLNIKIVFRYDSFRLKIAMASTELVEDEFMSNLYGEVQKHLGHPK